MRICDRCGNEWDADGHLTFGDEGLFHVCSACHNVDNEEVVNYKAEKVTPFVYLNSITYGKTNLMRDTENDSAAIKAFNAWIVNVGLSLYSDTIHQANYVNSRWEMPNRAAYEFLLNSVRRKKRYSKWPKKHKDDDIAAIRKLYGCNIQVAMEYLSVLTPEQLHIVKEEQEKVEKTE